MGRPRSTGGVTTVFSLITSSPLSFYPQLFSHTALQPFPPLSHSRSSAVPAPPPFPPPAVRGRCRARSARAPPPPRVWRGAAPEARSERPPVPALWRRRERERPSGPRHGAHPHHQGTVAAAAVARHGRQGSRGYCGAGRARPARRVRCGRGRCCFPSLPPSLAPSVARSCCFVAGASPPGALEPPVLLEGAQGSGRAAPVCPRVRNKGKTLKILV